MCIYQPSELQKPFLLVVKESNYLSSPIYITVVSYNIFTVDKLDATSSGIKSDDPGAWLYKDWYGDI